MTHKDIYTKFMIEYDKANVTSSYPSLTEYEVATVLDKAYNALIAQKVTGNNIRRAALEADLKSVIDIQPLIRTITTGELSGDVDALKDNQLTLANNVLQVGIKDDWNFLYFISCKMRKRFYTGVNIQDRVHQHVQDDYAGPIDQKNDSNSKERFRYVPVKLVSHQIAEKFMATASNIPWVKEPVCYMEDNNLYIVYDPYDKPYISGSDHDYTGTKIDITYIKKPHPFAKNLKGNTSWVSYFDWGTGDAPAEYVFECTDTVAEELISLAVAFALENVESQRLNSKLNMRGLEA